MPIIFHTFKRVSIEADKKNPSTNGRANKVSPPTPRA